MVIRRLSPHAQLTRGGLLTRVAVAGEAVAGEAEGESQGGRGAVFVGRAAAAAGAAQADGAGAHLRLALCPWARGGAGTCARAVHPHPPATEGALLEERASEETGNHASV